MRQPEPKVEIDLMEGCDFKRSSEMGVLYGPTSLRVITYVLGENIPRFCELFLYWTFRSRSVLWFAPRLVARRKRNKEA
jgi:hypothetical protein